MIERTIERWHRHLEGKLPEGLDGLLHDDVVFYSPVVFRPQRGKAVTKLYLQAAQQALPGDAAGPGETVGARGAGSEPASGRFRYVRQILSGNQALLEFETQVDGKYVNGVDLITCDDEGRIVEFKVMIRPLQAVNAVHARMARMLEALSGG